MQQRGLAAPGRPEHHHERGLVDVQVHVGESGDRGVPDDVPLGQSSRSIRVPIDRSGEDARTCEGALLSGTPPVSRTPKARGNA
jgi:hypothetical protein